MARRGRCRAGDNGDASLVLLANMEVIAMSSLFSRDFRLLERIDAMRKEQLHKLAEWRERMKKIRRWRT